MLHAAHSMSLLCSLLVVAKSKYYAWKKRGGKCVFVQLKSELIHRCRFSTRNEATEKVDEYLLRFYNQQHRVPLERRELEQTAQIELQNSK